MHQVASLESIDECHSSVCHAIGSNQQCSGCLSTKRDCHVLKFVYVWPEGWYEQDVEVSGAGCLEDQSVGLAGSYCKESEGRQD